MFAGLMPRGVQERRMLAVIRRTAPTTHDLRFLISDSEFRNPLRSFCLRVKPREGIFSELHPQTNTNTP
jgi:hypothetical protein